jgi:hypothetical protein
MGYRRNKPDAPDRVKAGKALDLRLSGMSYADIADRLGYAGESGPRNAVDRLLGRVEADNATELRRLESLKLDVLQAAVWDQAVAGDSDSIKLALAVHDRRVKLLGLAAPVAVDVRTDPGALISDYFAALRSGARPSVPVIVDAEVDK